MNLDDIPVAARALLVHSESGCAGDWRVSREHAVRVAHGLATTDVYRLTCEACLHSHVFLIRRLADEPAVDVPTDRRLAAVPDLHAHQEPARG